MAKQIDTRQTMFEATNVAPNPVYTRYWVDLRENAHGKMIKIYDENQWIPFLGKKSFLFSDMAVVSFNDYKSFVGDEAGFLYTQWNQDNNSYNEYQLIIPNATYIVSGLMSMADKIKFDSYFGTSNVNNRAMVSGVRLGTTTLTDISLDIVIATGGNTNMTTPVVIPPVSGGGAGVMSATDKTRLDKIWAALLANGTVS